MVIEVTVGDIKIKWGITKNGWFARRYTGTLLVCIPYSIGVLLSYVVHEIGTKISIECV